MISYWVSVLILKREYFDIIKSVLSFALNIYIYIL